MGAQVGDVIRGVGIVVRCGDCQGAGWVLHESVRGVRQVCPRCVGSGTLLDDGAYLVDERAT